jgi:signal transduction histidine kinase
MVGRNVSLLMPSPYREAHDGYLVKYLQSGERHVIGIGREVVAQRRDGTTFPADLAVSEIPHLQLYTGIIRDVTRRKELEREVVEIASLEKQRIAEDLHDSVGQELTALKMLAKDLTETIRTDPEYASQLAARMTQGLRRTQQELRAVLRGLLFVSADKQGLMAALTELAERIQRDGTPGCTFDCPEPVEVADNLMATHLYLIAQEAVHNVVKHARAQNIHISLRRVDGALVLRIRDDGIGMPPSHAESEGLGLRIMRNRAALLQAQLTIAPADPSGTVITCVLPGRFHEPKEDEAARSGADR